MADLLRIVCFEHVGNLREKVREEQFIGVSLHVNFRNIFIIIS